MSVSAADRALLNEFEQGLNVRQPGQSRIPARVLGYGEISTVLEIQSAQAGNLAYKRMPMFRDEAEVTEYAALYEEYVDVLHNRSGVQVVGGDLIQVLGVKGKIVAYIAQEKLPPQSIAHRAVQSLPADEVLKLVQVCCGKHRRSLTSIAPTLTNWNWDLTGRFPIGRRSGCPLRFAWSIWTPARRCCGRAGANNSIRNCFCAARPSFWPGCCGCCIWTKS
jgi:hypothetical protein